VYDETTRYEALGKLVEAASNLEMELRSVFCALIGSKYAAIAAAGRTVNDLIDTSRAIATAHREISEPTRARIRGLLTDAKIASDRRNRLIHDVWAFAGPNDPPMQLKSRRGDHTLPATPTTVDEIDEVARTLRDIGLELHGAMNDAMGLEAASIEAQLRWEEYLATLPPEQRQAAAYD
jgi:hypothetical protein